MTNSVFCSLVLSLCGLLLASCSSETPAPGGSGPVAPAGGGGDADGHHSDEDATDFGPVEVLGRTLSGKIFGKAVAGEDLAMNVTTGGGAIDAVRVWCGRKDGVGSRKVMVADHTHVDCPDPLDDDAALWFEVEVGDGRETVSVPLPR